MDPETGHYAGCPTGNAQRGECDCQEREVGPVLGMPTAKRQALHEYEQATVALRDAELAVRACQTRYRAALQKLNEAIAPIPAEAT